MLLERRVAGRKLGDRFCNAFDGDGDGDRRVERTVHPIGGARIRQCQ